MRDGPDAIDRTGAVRVLFVSSEAEARAAAVVRIGGRRPQPWQSLQQHAMKRDFGWERSARRYLDLYVDLAGRSAQVSAGESHRLVAAG